MSETSALYNEGEKLRDEGKYAEAVEKFQAVLAQKPDHVLSHMALAATYSNLGQFAEACQHAETACQLEPNESFNFVALSVTYQKAFEATRDPMYIEKAEQAKHHASMTQGGM